jgi:hypothetical protein
VLLDPVAHPVQVISSYLQPVQDGAAQQAAQLAVCKVVVVVVVVIVIIIIINIIIILKLPAHASGLQVKASQAALEALDDDTDTGTGDASNQGSAAVGVPQAGECQ